MAEPLKQDSETSASPALPARGWRLPRMQEFGLIVVVLLLGTTLSIYGYFDAQPGHPNTFLNPDTLLDQVATPMSYYAIMAVGLTFVIITGGIDISVGSIMALAGLGTAAILQRFDINAPAWQVLPVAIGIPMAIGLACGLINGLLLTGLRLHSFIVTLGTLSIYRGIAVVSKVGTLPGQEKYLPLAFSVHLMRLRLFALEPVPFLIVLVCVLVGWFYLSFTVGGREIYAVGGNEEAARFSGLRVNRVKLRVYAVSGLCAGIAGMVSLGHFGTASTATAYGYELTVIAAAVVGGASLLGGRGTALGALLGALVITMIDAGIFTMHRDTQYRLIIDGAAIVIAAALDNFSEDLRQRRLAGAKRI